jgi:hypothetical protein
MQRRSILQALAGLVAAPAAVARPSSWARLWPFRRAPHDVVVPFVVPTLPARGPVGSEANLQRCAAWARAWRDFGVRLQRARAGEESEDRA